MQLPNTSEEVSVADVPFLALAPDQAAKFVIDQTGTSGIASDFHFVCASSVYFAELDKTLSQLFQESTGNFADGKSIVGAAKFLGASMKQVRGPSLFLDVLDKGRSKGLRHFFIGSTPETLQKLQQNILAKFPGVIISGVYSPPFREMTAEEQKQQDELIRKSGANIVWLGISSPKQDFEAKRLSVSLPAVVLAVGAAFDFAAGTQKEAPIWIRRLSLEWLFRLISNPRRLWKRYLVGNWVFIKAVIKYRRKTL